MIVVIGSYVYLYSVPPGRSPLRNAFGQYALTSFRIGYRTATTGENRHRPATSAGEVVTRSSRTVVGGTFLRRAGQARACASAARLCRCRVSRVPVRGAAGGVGTAAIQLARATWEPTRFSTTAPPPRTGPGPFDVILDTVGSELHCYRSRLAKGGRMVTVGLSAPP